MLPTTYIFPTFVEIGWLKIFEQKIFYFSVENIAEKTNAVILKIIRYFRLLEMKLTICILNVSEYLYFPHIYRDRLVKILEQ